MTWDDVAGAGVWGAAASASSAWLSSNFSPAKISSSTGGVGTATLGGGVGIGSEIALVLGLGNAEDDAPEASGEGVRESLGLGVVAIFASGVELFGIGVTAIRGAGVTATFGRDELEIRGLGVVATRGLGVVVTAGSTIDGDTARAGRTPEVPGDLAGATSDAGDSKASMPSPTVRSSKDDSGEARSSSAKGPKGDWGTVSSSSKGSVMCAPLAMGSTEAGFTTPGDLAAIPGVLTGGGGGGGGGGTGDAATAEGRSKLISRVMTVTSRAGFQPDIPSFQTWTSSVSWVVRTCLAASLRVKGPCRTPFTETYHSTTLAGDSGGGGGGGCAPAGLGGGGGGVGPRLSPESGRAFDS